MLDLVYHVLFLLFTIYVLIESISYAIFEIKEQKNTLGATSVVAFSVFCVVFANIVVWKN